MASTIWLKMVLKPMYTSAGQSEEMPGTELDDSRQTPDYITPKLPCCAARALEPGLQLPPSLPSQMHSMWFDVAVVVMYVAASVFAAVARSSTSSLRRVQRSRKSAQLTGMRVYFHAGCRPKLPHAYRREALC